MAFALAFTYPILGHLREFGAFHDWEFTTSMTWVPYYTVLHFHQLPLWDGYRCGGIPMIGNPQSRVVTPFFLLNLAFGPFVGPHLELILHIAAAFMGAYVAARVLGLRPLASIVAGAAFGSTSWFYLHGSEGHQILLAAAYMPWIAAFFWISLEYESWTAAIVAGMILALTFLGGVVYTFVWATMLVGCLTIGYARVRLSLHPIITASVIWLSSLGFVLVKLLPALEVVRRYPRELMGSEVNPLSLLSVLLFSRNQIMAPRPEISGFGFWEYGAYVSIPFAILAVVGLFGSRRRTLPWLVVGGVFLIFYMGDTGPYALWNLVRNYAGLRAMRFPTRSLIGFVLSISMLAAIGADVICTSMGRWGCGMVAFLVGIGLCDAWLVGPPNLVHIFDNTDVPYGWSSEFKQTSQPMSRFHVMPNLQSNIGVIPCYEYTLITTAVKGFEDPDYAGEQYIRGGRVSLIQWTPNILSYDVDAPAAGELVLNRNYDQWWRLTTGNGQVVSEGGLLAVKLPTGRQHLKLAYRNLPCLFGLGVAIVSFLTLIAIGWIEMRHKTLNAAPLA